MNLEERIILWLVQHEAASDERDLLNDALEELEQAREQLEAFSDGVNRRCGADANQLPLVSMDRLVAENERLTRWRDLAVAAAAAGAEQEVFKRFAESEAILPIIQAWKDKVADLTARLAEAEAALVNRSLAETRYEELRELIACGSRSMAHEDLVKQLRVNNELIVTRDQKVTDAWAEAAQWRVVVPMPTKEDPERMLEMEVIAIDHKEHVITVSAYVHEAALEGKP